ncbi:AAA domain-containing protein [Nocardia sp. X0981]
MFVVGDRVVCGAADLVRAARCEFAWLRALDAELGSVTAPPGPTAGRETTEAARAAHAETGEFARVLAAVADRYGSEPVPVRQTPGAGPDTAHAETLALLRGGAPAILDATLADNDFFAHTELLLPTIRGARLHGSAADSTRLIPVALRLTAAAALLAEQSIPVDPVLRVYRATETHTFDLSETMPVYRARRQRLDHILSEHSSELLPVQWGDPRFRACRRCATCAAAAAAARDLLLVAGMDAETRTGLRASGITSIDRLTTRTAAPAGIPARTLTRLRAQAVVQLRQENSGRGEYVTADPSALDMLPPTTPGDLALDHRWLAPDRLRIEVATRESVRLVRELPLAPRGTRLPPERRRELRRAFTDLLAALTEPLLADPELHIFHYTTAARDFLLHTGGCLGYGEETVDTLLRAGTLVDLYPIVRGAYTIGTASYALDEVAPVLGTPPDDSPARTLLALADRLRKRADELPVSSGPGPESLDLLLRATPAVQPSDTEAALTEFAARPAGRTDTAAGPEADPLAEPDAGSVPALARPPDPHRIAALTAALLGYHRREQQAPWWAHIDRLTHPLPEWPAAPGVMVADSAAVDTKWHIGPDETVRRFLRLTGRLAGTGLAPGTRVYVVYEPLHRAQRAIRTCGTATVLGCSVDADSADIVRLEETLEPGAEPHDELPVALAPALAGFPVPVADAVEEAGRQLLMTLPAVPEAPLFDLLGRRPPRLHAHPTEPGTGPTGLPDAGDGPVTAIARTLRRLDRSYLAVQAPTGTGRTAILAGILADLVTRDNWRIGIVAPTPTPVENLLDAVVRAGVLPELVAKSEAVAVAPEWLVLDADRYPRFLANAIRGCVLGGAAADFADAARVPRAALDLLVIADANACPLATTAAVAVSARNLLLIGDPADRYPETATAHPEPVGTPALSWLTAGRRTLPPSHGYFLNRTHRMHPRVCEPLSYLYFDDRLRAAPVPEPPADAVEPGIHTVLVDHHGNSTASDAEAREVLHQIRGLLGRRWFDGAAFRPLQAHDIVVVSPHRAQVSRIRALLSRARFDEILVGTPELFRGREAAVVLVSPATSGPEDAPGPVGALLSPALVHDALCRARRRAIIVRSPLLTEFLPETASELSALSRFLRL